MDPFAPTFMAGPNWGHPYMHGTPHHRTNKDDVIAGGAIMFSSQWAQNHPQNRDAAITIVGDNRFLISNDPGNPNDPYSRWYAKSPMIFGNQWIEFNSAEFDRYMELERMQRFSSIFAHETDHIRRGDTFSTFDGERSAHDTQFNYDLSMGHPFRFNPSDDGIRNTYRLPTVSSNR